jgi:coproporphyrinogen III oxidase
MASGMMPSFAPEAERWIAGLHDEISEFFETLDGKATFREDRWERPGGGGGHSRVMIDGDLFEKAGVNRSVVHGTLPPAAVARLGGRAPEGESARFFATGVSLVMHPHNPHVPTVHLNVRYFELSAMDGTVLDGWFGGGTDLTPFMPWEEDAVDFHRVLKETCDAHDSAYYPRFKAWCDDYFVNTHRDQERRGVGGVFFDNLRPGVDGMPARDALHAFVYAIGAVLPSAYGPIANRRRQLPFTEAQRHFQLLRRGRYVEFNLVHDRGTIFGLQTAARIESVLMSLPPLAAWDYAPEFAPGSEEARLIAMLAPREWVS